MRRAYNQLVKLREFMCLDYDMAKICFIFAYCYVLYLNLEFLFFSSMDSCMHIVKHSNIRN